MFCEKCGTKLEIDSVFCTSCGTRVIETPPQNQFVNNGSQQFVTNQVPNQGNVTYGGNFIPQRPKNKLMILIAAAAVALVVIILAVVLLSSGSSYTAPLDHMIKGMQTGNTDEFIKAFPEFMKPLMAIGSANISELTTYMKQECGDDFKVSYKVTKAEKMSKSDITALENEIQALLFKKYDITDGYTLSYNIKVKGSKKEETGSGDIRVYKIGSGWYAMDIVDPS
jgi:uncharacterized membrane protein YvbJ